MVSMAPVQEYIVTGKSCFHLGWQTSKEQAEWRFIVRDVRSLISRIDIYRAAVAISIWMAASLGAICRTYSWSTTRLPWWSRLRSTTTHRKYMVSNFLEREALSFSNLATIRGVSASLRTTPPSHHSRSWCGTSNRNLLCKWMVYMKKIL